MTSEEIRSLAATRVARAFTGHTQMDHNLWLIAFANECILLTRWDSAEVLSERATELLQRYHDEASYGDTDLAIALRDEAELMDNLAIIVRERGKP